MEDCRASLSYCIFDLFRIDQRQIAIDLVIKSTMTRVFIVDDQPAFRRQLRDCLTYAGLAIVGEAGSIEEALDQLPSASPDLAVVDVEMPGISGLDGVSLLKQAAPDLRIILVSAYLDQSEMLVKAAERVGAEAFIPKENLDLEVIKAWDQG